MAKKRNLKTSLVMSLFLLAIVSTAGAEIIYVDVDASTPGDGQTWGTAYKYLQDGLGAGVSGDQIWVADGIYKPDANTGNPTGTGDRFATFELKNGVAIYAGFAGGQSSLDERDWETNETILSGDLNGDDGPDFANNGDNSYHVVTGSGTDETAVLDGFIITAGNANGSKPYDRGAGMYNDNGSPTLTNCMFTDNTAVAGGGMGNTTGSDPTLTNCTFSKNSVRDHQGGGMANWDSSPTLTNCTFSGNSADVGGGMANYPNSSPTLTNCVFSGNQATLGAGGMFNQSHSSPTLTTCTFSGNSSKWGGGMSNYDHSSPMLTNCVFSGNSGYDGGGMENYVQCSPTLTNCTFSGNSASQFGGGMDNSDNSSPTLTNSILWGNTAPSGPQIYNDGTGSATVSYSDVQGGWPGTGNINENPLFVDSAIGDYHFKSQAGRWDSNSQSWVKDDVTSPCIDRGQPHSDWSDELWPHGGRINLGAYGGTPQGSMSLSTVGNVADLNIDNAVNAKDFASFADTWQTEQVLLPQDLDRNRTVDFSDLGVFADNWLEEVEPVGLVAHWKLDETEGIVAHNSAGDNDAFLAGLWQPTAGKVDGALKFNGTDNYISTDFVLNPVSESFSAFAWIKGGQPGQVIISQLDRKAGRFTHPGSAWLGTDPSDGKLITTLMELSFGTLESESVITDGQWHDVGLVYDLDGMCRYLYVDGVEVARDADPVGGAGSSGGLHFGTGRYLDAGSFFSGLMDDIRIYPVALTAKEIEELTR